MRLPILKSSELALADDHYSRQEVDFVNQNAGLHGQRVKDLPLYDHATEIVVKHKVRDLLHVVGPSRRTQGCWVGELGQKRCCLGRSLQGVNGRRKLRKVLRRDSRLLHPIVRKVQETTTQGGWH